MSTPQHTAPRILFAAGGTGGHVYPAIAIADAVRALAPEATIAFAGTREKMEWQAVPRAGYPIHGITVSALHREISLRNLAFPFKLAKGLYDSYRLVKGFDPDVVVGAGGFVSGPVLLAASVKGVPIVVQEQNAFAGLTNKLLAKRAEEIHVAFEEAKNAFPEATVVVSGNPTRDDLRHATRPEGRAFYQIPENARLLFVFGGSLGSQKLNETLLAHLPELLEDDTLHILWQTGSHYFDRMTAAAPDHERLHLHKYIDRMDLAYAATDLVLCRAGAITCSELMVTGTPAVLVPSPNVAEDHQTHNARSMEKAGAARLLPEADLDAQLVETVRALLADPAARDAMVTAALRLARPDAAERIARRVLAIAEEGR